MEIWVHSKRKRGLSLTWHTQIRWCKGPKHPPLRYMLYYSQQPSSKCKIAAPCATACVMALTRSRPCASATSVMKVGLVIGNSNQFDVPARLITGSRMLSKVVSVDETRGCWPLWRSSRIILTSPIVFPLTSLRKLPETRLDFWLLLGSLPQTFQFFLASWTSIIKDR